MKKAYLLAYSNDVGTREEMVACLNSIPEIATWRSDMSNAFYIISDQSALALSSSIRKVRSSGKFIVTEITSNKQGWLTADSWYLINNLTHRPKQ